MDKTLSEKNLLLLIILLGILLIIPLTLLLLSQRQEIRKRAGEYPPTVVFVPRYVKTTPDQILTFTLLLQGGGLQNGKLDGADIVFQYPKDFLRLVHEDGAVVNEGEEAVTRNTNLPDSLERVLNKMTSGPGNSNTVIFSLKNKIVNGRPSFTPSVDPETKKVNDIVLGTVRFKTLAVSNATIGFNDDFTVIAGGGVNNTNFDVYNREKRNVLVQIKESDVSILRAFPSNKVVGYAGFNMTLSGENFRNTHRVKIGSSDCSSPVVGSSGKSLTCSMSSGLGLGSYDIQVSDSANQNKTVAVLEKGFFVYDSTTPILSLNLRFFGVNSSVEDIVEATPEGLDYIHQWVKLRVISEDGSKVFGKRNVLLTAKTSNSLTTFKTELSETADDRIPLVGMPAGKYDILIKGPKHVQKKFTLDLIAGNNLLERTNPDSILMGGDLPLESTGGQDGRVNSIDYNYYLCGNNTCPNSLEISGGIFESRDPLVLEKADLTLDGSINRGDPEVIVQTTKEERDEDE